MMDGENAECIVQYDWIVQIGKKKMERRKYCDLSFPCKPIKSGPACIFLYLKKKMLLFSLIRKVETIVAKFIF